MAKNVLTNTASGCVKKAKQNKTSGAPDNCIVIKGLGEMMRTIAHSLFFKKYVTMGSSNMGWYICHRQACDFDKVLWRRIF